jgi:membrane-associated phospholipid phosphatase
LLTNIILFFFGIIFLTEKDFLKKIPFDIKKIFNLFLNEYKLLLIIIAAFCFHLFEVNFIDPIVTEWVGYDYANMIVNFENGIIYWFSQNWNPALLYFFVLIYIIVYPFSVWFSLLYFVLDEQKKALKSLSYALVITYIIALPFYLFFPVTNVYTFYNLNSPLEIVIPNIEQFFYKTTTCNNCLPSLHTAMTIFIAYCGSLTNNKKFAYFTYFMMVSVIISVFYLSIHWITDVIAGAVTALVTIFLLERFIHKKERHE